MILSIPGELQQVDEATYRWFTARAKQSRSIDFANGTGCYSDGTLIAARIDPNLFYVRVRGSSVKKPN